MGWVTILNIRCVNKKALEIACLVYLTLLLLHCQLLLPGRAGNWRNLSEHHRISSWSVKLFFITQNTVVPREICTNVHSNVVLDNEVCGEKNLSSFRDSVK